MRESKNRIDALPWNCIMIHDLFLDGNSLSLYDGSYGRVQNSKKKKEKKACRYRIVLGHIAAGSGRILYCLFPSSHVPEKMVMDPCFDSNSDCRYRLSGHGTHE